MYGELGRLAGLMDAPLGWAYCSLLALYTRLGINLHDADPKIHPTMYVALLGDKGAGKSTVMRRAKQMLRVQPDDLQGAPNSDRGLIQLFRAGLDRKDPAPPVSGGCIVADEMRELMSKMAIKGSTLQQKLCELWSSDYLDATDRNGTLAMRARVSILGNLKIKDRDEFSTLFGAATQDGFFDRMVLVPGPESWDFDWEWTVPGQSSMDLTGEVEDLIDYQPPKPTGEVTVPSAIFALLKSWEAEHKAQDVRPGRLGEIALRNAIISASANGDKEVTEECMTAALAFADWQMQVRRVYTAGEAENDGAKVTGLILNAFDELEAADRIGKPICVGGRPILQKGWVDFRLLQHKKNWHKRYSAAMVNSTIRSLVESHLIEQGEEIISEQPLKVKKTNKYRIIKGDV
jgi:hypothetical protein